MIKSQYLFCGGFLYMSSNELTLWIFLTILELILIYPIILRLIKSERFSTLQYKQSQNINPKPKEKDTYFN